MQWDNLRAVGQPPTITHGILSDGDILRMVAKRREATNAAIDEYGDDPTAEQRHHIARLTLAWSKALDEMERRGLAG